jgi:23S rRNA pseudoU1915 N3-methylase RlmH
MVYSFTTELAKECKLSIVSNKAVKRDKAAEAALKKRQQARKMLEKIKELESLIFECSTIGVCK